MLEETNKNIYYKAFTPELTSLNRYQFAIGGTFRVEEKIAMCTTGFHCCKNAMACLDYYPLGSRFCEVEISGDYKTAENKTVAEEITVLREITGTELDDLLTGCVSSNYLNRCTIWYSKGLKHREGDKPAVIWANGCREWYIEGKLHREGDKPAVIWANGEQRWYVEGKRKTPAKEAR